MRGDRRPSRPDEGLVLPSEQGRSSVKLLFPQVLAGEGCLQEVGSSCCSDGFLMLPPPLILLRATVGSIMPAPGSGISQGTSHACLTQMPLASMKSLSSSLPSSGGLMVLGV